jgi:DNA invertase Pin-like site-specific DNA recombinase
MQKAAIYARVSTPEQCLENQLYDLREMASRCGYQVVHEYTDVGSGSKTRRAGLDAMLAAARRRRFDIVLVAAFDQALDFPHNFRWLDLQSCGDVENCAE